MYLWYFLFLPDLLFPILLSIFSWFLSLIIVNVTGSGRGGKNFANIWINYNKLRVSKEGVGTKCKGVGSKKFRCHPLPQILKKDLTSNYKLARALLCEQRYATGNFTSFFLRSYVCFSGDRHPLGQTVGTRRVTVKYM